MGRYQKQPRRNHRGKNSLYKSIHFVKISIQFKQRRSAARQKLLRSSTRDAEKTLQNHRSSKICRQTPPNRNRYAKKLTVQGTYPQSHRNGKTHRLTLMVEIADKTRGAMKYSKPPQQQNTLPKHRPGRNRYAKKLTVQGTYPQSPHSEKANHLTLTSRNCCANFHGTGKITLLIK